MSESIQVFARVDRQLHDRILQRQAEAKKLTGIEPSISEIVRMLIERGLAANGRKR